MFIFIDTAQLTKVLKKLRGLCIKCNQNNELTLYKTYQCLRLFFIPIWCWGERYYVRDEYCGVVYQISEEDAILVRYGKKDIGACQLAIVLQSEEKAETRCINCHKSLDKAYVFCPYCGQKRKREEV